MQNKDYLYAFVLGNNPTLSIAELFSNLEKNFFVFITISISREVLIIKTEKEIEKAQDFLDNLGGIIKIIKIIKKVERFNIQKEILEYIERKNPNSKYIFAISVYGDKKSKEIGFDIKKKLKNKKISSRLLKSKSKNISAAEAKNNKIIQKGDEFSLIKVKKDCFLGTTIAIQDFESYSFRDYNRPRRNAKSGMLPPKLAQIMINLLPEKVESIYDPFCGNGTVLSEASLMGFEISGSDLSDRAVEDTRENLLWINKKFSLNMNAESIEKNITKLDARKIKNKKSLSIVSELYLGPPLDKEPTKEQIREIEENLKPLYLEFLNNIYKYAEQLVIAIPFYATNNNYHYYQLNIIDDIKKIGYNVQSPLKKIKNKDVFKELDQKRKTILYKRNDQIVGREIMVLVKK